LYIAIGHVTFLLFLLITAVYFKERLLNCDAAYYTFHVINYEEFFVKHERYISYFTQWLPLLMIKLGASLKVVMMAYSVAFGLWFYGLFLMAAHWWKNPRGGLYIALALFLAMRYKHFAGHTEITFAIAVASLLVVWVTTDKSGIKWYNPWIDRLFKLLFILWLYIIHPIIIIPLAFVLGIDVIYHKRWKDWEHWIFLFLLGLAFVIRFMTVAKDSYESGKINILASASEVFSHPEDYYVFQIVNKYLIQEYIPALILLGGVLIWMSIKKRFLTVLTLIIGTALITALVIVTYSYLQGDIYIMIDGYLGMLGMIWGFGFYLYLLYSKRHSWQPIVLSLLLLYSLGRIWEKHYVLEYRLEGFSQTFDMYPDQPKLFAPLALHDWDILWYPYEIPLETLMLSSLKGPEHSKTLFIDYDVLGTKGYLDSTDFFISFNNKMPIADLNPKFFRLSSEKPYFLIDDVSWE
jgi:hypothetical protein